MNITFFGAAHEVTGSCHLLDTGSKKILLDCGMFQGSDFNEGKNNDTFPFDPKSVDMVLVSHAHADHCGRVPKLIKEGFSGPIYMTKGTQELAKIIWEDSYHIMSYNNRKFQSPILFYPEDIEAAYSHSTGVLYNETIDLGSGISVVFKDAGHIFGAAFIEISVNGKTLCYSGDIGNKDVPILRETEQLGSLDTLLIESTYGNRLHESRKDREKIFFDIFKEAIARGGTIMMPAFSLERTQEILYTLNDMFENKKLLPKIPIFLDSPMAIRAIDVYKAHPEYYDEEAFKKYSAGDDFFEFPNLTLTLRKEDSIKINSVKGPKCVIAGSGMMNGGRILHHAKRYLPDERSMLVIVGYQAKNTLGRKLYEGARQVTIHNDSVSVKAKVTAIGALSAHGDQKKLVNWVRHAKKVPKTVFCVHGEAVPATALAHKLHHELGIEAFVPEEGECFTL
ncbi:MAG: hypothetical protein CL685_03170 [Candidatus Magasanikbacteria bacterium]|nr:hypothetical protein [Candidatus Magasanikbacteria bacterium]